MKWVIVAMLWAVPVLARAAIPVVAAESVYGDVAAELSGPAASVTSILANPDQDPHLFEASPSVARGLASARIVVVNGAEYDPWMGDLLAAHAAPDRIVITVADLMGRKPGDNPHLWYDPGTMPAFARAFTAALDRIEPLRATDHAARLGRFLASLAPLQARIDTMRAAYAGVPVTATEPVFGDMAAALGLVMRNERFQVAVMNDSEPAPSDVAEFEQDLRGHAVRALLFNSQASDMSARRLVGIARDAHVPVVGVSETEPMGTHYVAWMMSQLEALRTALSVAP